MLLEGRNGHRLELTLTGYEFPAIEDDRWDSNWLHIRIAATSDRGSWTASHPSLLTSEAASLADWLDAIAESRDMGPELEFTEPNLAFELVAGADRVRLRAWFELELRPGWASWEEVPQRDLCVDLDVARSDLRAAAEAIRAQLAALPPR